MSKSPIERIVDEFVPSDGALGTATKRIALRTTLESYRTEIREERDREILGAIEKMELPDNVKSHPEWAAQECPK